jgi:hypothetical protein
MLVSGFVVYEILSEWIVTKSILLTLPNIIENTLNITGKLKGTVKAVTLFVILPLVFYLSVAFFKKIFAKEHNLKQVFSDLVLALLPITASMHLVKAMLKTSSRIPYWNYVFTDPKGINTANAIMNNPEYLNKTILNTLNPVLSILAFLIPLGGLIISFYVIKNQKINTVSKFISLITVIFYAGIFLSTIIAWRFL